MSFYVVIMIYKSMISYVAEMGFQQNKGYLSNFMSLVSRYTFCLLLKKNNLHSNQYLIIIYLLI